VACTASDSGSGLANPGDASFTLSTTVGTGVETGSASTNSRQVCDSAGNCATAGPIAGIKVDRKPPTITASQTPPPNSSGWNDTTVTVTFACSDSGSGVAHCPPPVKLAEGADQVVTGTASDNVGNNASVTASGINVDLTPPLVTYSGNAGTYTVDQTINIACIASDALSGVASSTCSKISAPAWSFPLGANSRTANAIDVAGNTGSGSTTFKVIVTHGSLDNLIVRFFGSDANDASSLIAKADKIGLSAGALQAFDQEVDAKTGKPLTTAQAALLKRLAAAL
jgi:hypothetical protein